MDQCAGATLTADRVGQRYVNALVVCDVHDPVRWCGDSKLVHFCPKNAKRVSRIYVVVSGPPICHDLASFV
jgi:hypothetical protein